MANLSYNEFRSLHKGTPQGEMSELWKKYKAGEYQPDADNDGIHDSVDDDVSLSTEEEFAAKNKVAELVEEENPDLLEDEVPEKTPEQIYQENLLNFANAYRLLQNSRHRLTEEQIQILEVRLINCAKATRPSNFHAKPEDGWQLWVGPHPEALIVNERNQIAFCITRAWWAKNYQGSFLVQDMILDEPSRLASIRDKFRKKGKLVLRNPIPGIEIKLPASRLEAIVTSSGSYEG
tara:strand:+ start:606 stop:1310 length:705 start_codon:yes stop_codon:yes gene_type:complete